VPYPAALNASSNCEPPVAGAAFPPAAGAASLGSTNPFAQESSMDKAGSCGAAFWNWGADGAA
jgi:hypothetical protein